MRYRQWIRMGLALLMVAGTAALGGAHWASAQGNFPEGAFVIGADGTRWVVGNGVRYRISFLIDDAGQLQSLREGSTVVGTIAEALAALRSGGPGGAAAPAPSGASDPAGSLVGQQTRACTYGVDMDIAVARAEATRTLLGTTAPGNAMWLVVLINVTNVSNNAESLTTRPLQLRDRQGRVYEVREYPPDPVDLTRTYGVHAPYERFQPGITEQSVVTFQVPQNVGQLTLVGKRDFC